MNEVHCPNRNGMEKADNALHRIAVIGQIHRSQPRPAGGGNQHEKPENDRGDGECRCLLSRLRLRTLPPKLRAARGNGMHPFRAVTLELSVQYHATILGRIAIQPEDLPRTSFAQTHNLPLQSLPFLELS